MPTEAQLKAQMQAAIAKKKLEAAKGKIKPIETVKDVVESPPPQPEPIAAAQKPAIEVVTEHAAPPAGTPNPVAAPIPNSLTFYGASVRFTTFKQDVYFAVIDLLPLSKHLEYFNLFLDFKNNPATKAKAEELIKILTFAGPQGSERLEGATALNVLAIFREMELSAPGPLGRWLRENAASRLRQSS